MHYPLSMLVNGWRGDLNYSAQGDLKAASPCVNNARQDIRFLPSIADGIWALQVTHLLSLPEEILQEVAGHLTLKEWEQGPAQACRLFHCIDLPRVELSCRRHLVSPDFIPHHLSVHKCMVHAHSSCLYTSSTTGLLTAATVF